MGNVKQLARINAVIESLNVALELCDNSSLMMEGVVTAALNNATALQGLMLNALEWPGTSPAGPEGHENSEDDDFSWMDDMEAAGVAAV